MRADIADDVATADVLERVLYAHPEVHAGLADAWAAAWSSIDPLLLELCRLRTAQLLGCHAERSARTPAAVAAGFTEALAEALPSWPASPMFGPRERACLAFTEHYLMDVASLDDATAQAVHEHLGAEGLASFVSALLVVEQRMRLRIAWERLFAGAA